MWHCSPSGRRQTGGGAVIRSTVRLVADGPLSGEAAGSRRNGRLALAVTFVGLAAALLAVGGRIGLPTLIGRGFESLVPGLVPTHTTPIEGSKLTQPVVQVTHGTGTAVSVARRSTVVPDLVTLVSPKSAGRAPVVATGPVVPPARGGGGSGGSAPAPAPTPTSPGPAPSDPPAAPAPIPPAATNPVPGPLPAASPLPPISAAPAVSTGTDGGTVGAAVDTGLGLSAGVTVSTPVATPSVTVTVPPLGLPKLP